MQHFTRLRVTAQARTVNKAIYSFTRSLPGSERFGLVSQMRRASISIGLNIAEGCSRQTTKEFLRFLEISRGSGMELEFALVVTEDLALGSATQRAEAAEQVDHVQRELSALMHSLRRRLAAGTRE